MKIFTLMFWFALSLGGCAGYFTDRALRAPIHVDCGHAPSAKQTTPPAAAGPNSTAPHEFDSTREAALYALRMVYVDLPYYESGGVIVRLSDGKFAIGQPRTNFAGDRVYIDRDPVHYAGIIVADYHLHPCLERTHYPNSFSPDDVDNYRVFHEIGYMGSGCDGALREFINGVDEDHSAAHLTSPGRIVGYFAVSGKNLDAGLPDDPDAQWPLPY